MTRVLLVGYDLETVDYSNPAYPPGMSVEKISMERVERHTTHHLHREIMAVEEGIEGALRPIRAEEKKKTEGEDWSLIEEYLKSCLQRLASVFEPRLGSK